ncbi:TMV resistance protein N [Vitis vinifera]|uniref:ADP-ribosyl cyclase/cyclic ADP-ribose hydrolase n=1 Tax=Vitis vinifera TaxID=29760 RepID=A0A438IJA6_VITVI|nr:TMV resistance protein N [Vitis vinifera]
MNTKLNMVSVVGIYGIGGVGKTTIAKAIYNEISDQYDDYANGLPLALKVLGASLFGKKISEWESALYMHDLIQLMGWEVIRQECPEDPGRRSRLWDSNAYHVLIGNTLHDKLRVIDLSYSVHLIRIPDFSSVPNLEILTLEGCVNLELLSRGIYKWKHLQTLSCNGCSKLERFPEIKGNMRELRVLDLSGTAIRDLPSSITHLNGLQTLLLQECLKLHQIPNHICHLSSLKELDLGHCNIMEGGIPSDICHLSSLQKLNLERGHFSSIPTTINQLSRLEVLNLSHCNNLEQIPELPSRLRLLDAHGSNRTSSRAPFLPLHSLVNCFSWAQDSKRTSFSDSFYHGKGTCIFLPGGDVIPKGIMDRTNRHFERTELPQNWHQNNEFLGFAIFCVYVPLVDESEDIPEKESAHGSENESDNKSGDESTRTWENETDDKSVAESFYFPFFQSNCFCYKEDKDEDNESVSGETLVPVFKYEKTMEVNRCGFHLIYSEDLHQSHPLTTQRVQMFRICNECQCDGGRDESGCFGCSDMNEVPIIENPLELDRLYILQDMENLRNLYLDRTAIKEIPSSIERLRGLQHLTLINCINLVNLPDSICNLTSLRKLSVQSRIPDGISQLYNLTFLDLSHCKMLQHIPELPSGGCKYRNVTTFIAESNGIPEWISHQKSGFKITMKLPWSWYENDDFLGVVLCSLIVPLEIETVTYGCFICKLNFDDDGEYFICERAQFCQCCYDDDASSQQCMIESGEVWLPLSICHDYEQNVEDTNTDVERSCNGTTLNIDGNGVDAQDHEMDHICTDGLSFFANLFIGYAVQDTNFK